MLHLTSIAGAHSFVHYFSNSEAQCVSMDLGAFLRTQEKRKQIPGGALLPPTVWRSWDTWAGGDEQVHGLRVCTEIWNPPTHIAPNALLGLHAVFGTLVFFIVQNITHHYAHEIGYAKNSFKLPIEQA